MLTVLGDTVGGTSSGGLRAAHSSPARVTELVYLDDVAGLDMYRSWRERNHEPALAEARVIGVVHGLHT